MRRAIIVACLECYALLLALLQWTLGVDTDEAKYLLNIPYPHPPGVRWALSLFDGLAMQEILVRVLLATVLVQAVWLVWDTTRGRTEHQRLLLATLWLTCGGLVMQAGTVMMAPLTAVQGLALFYFTRRQVPPAYIGVLWLFSLFTAYQTVLFAPIAVAALLHQRCSLRAKALYFLVPLALLALYTATNPLIIASFAIHGSRDLHSSVFDRTLATLHLWAIGGSGILSLFGTYGMFRSRSLPVAASFLLVFAYVALSRHDYYAVLFAPLLLAGAVERPAMFRFPHTTVLAAAAIAGVLLFQFTRMAAVSSARMTVERLVVAGAEGPLLIEGSFGHQWQYESPWPVYRFTDARVENAGAVVCLERCPDWDRSSWRVLQTGPETWVKLEWLAYAMP